MREGETDGSLQIQSDLLHEPGSHVVLGRRVRGAVRDGSPHESTWPVFEPYADTLLLAALGAACFITSVATARFIAVSRDPFLVAAIVAALIEAGIWGVSEEVLWGVVLIGVALAFPIEWRVVGREGHSSRAYVIGRQRLVPAHEGP